jgi:hypothetical protein
MRGYDKQTRRDLFRHIELESALDGISGWTLLLRRIANFFGLVWKILVSIPDQPP